MSKFQIHTPRQSLAVMHNLLRSNCQITHKEEEEQLSANQEAATVFTWRTTEYKGELWSWEQEETAKM